MVTFAGPNVVLHTAVQQMEVLGTMLDTVGCTETSMMHRRKQAERNFWRNSRVLLRPGDRVAKFRAWTQTSGASAIHDVVSWNISRGILHDLRTWELKLLRRIFMFRPIKKLGEIDDHAAYNTRAAQYIYIYIFVVCTF